MAVKNKVAFVCSECGNEVPRWSGKCSQCGSWNTLVETIIETKPKTLTSNNLELATNVNVHELNNIDLSDEVRYKTEISELDRVLGGGLVKGSVVLLSGDPGIGKSTILMQMCGSLSKNISVLYVSGEESYRQLKLRAQRLNVDSQNIAIMTETNVDTICNYIIANKPSVVMIDSIQTMFHPEISSSAGSVSQVRECTNMLLRTGKSLEIPIIIVGHVNKDGAIAGPKVMEHIVDAVLYFEGERNYSYRIMRAVKNRFGSTNEIGVFEMTDEGLEVVENPSSALISGRMTNVSGSTIACVMEGSRPILAEIQSIISTTGFGNPRRMTTGFDLNRLNMILAVLEKRMGFYFSNMDAYLNIIGGLKLDEPASDLSVAVALISGLKDTVVPENVVVFGEIGLSGEVRSVPRVALRVNEAVRLGFTKCIVPYDSIKGKTIKKYDNVEIIGVRSIREAIANIF